MEILSTLLVSLTALSCAITSAGRAKRHRLDWERQKEHERLQRDVVAVRQALADAWHRLKRCGGGE